MATLGKGDVWAGPGWLTPYHWRFNARAVEVTRAIALDGKCLRPNAKRIMTSATQLLKRFAQIVDQRLEATRLQLLDVYAAHR